MAWYKIVMQQFLVVYRGMNIPQVTCIFSVYTRGARKRCITSMLLTVIYRLFQIDCERASFLFFLFVRELHFYDCFCVCKTGVME